MLYLDIAKACNSKGIDDPRRWLVKNGFNYVTAARLINNTQDSITYAILEKLSLLLFCTPNDLLSWKPNETVTQANHPLLKLTQVPKEQSIAGQLRKLSPDKIAEVQQFLAELNKEK
ncbi:MAG: hypothetical protein ABIX01_02420 [Chitinophagaceae bacterium]